MRAFSKIEASLLRAEENRETGRTSVLLLLLFRREDRSRSEAQADLPALGGKENHSSNHAGVETEEDPFPKGEVVELVRGQGYYAAPWERL